MKDQLSKKAGREGVLGALREAVGNAKGKRVGLLQFLAATGLKRRDVFRHFARWEEALGAAGCEFEPRNVPIARERLLEDWGMVAKGLGRAPTRAEYKVRGKYAVGTVERRCGRWGMVREAFLEFAKGKRGWREVVKLIESGDGVDRAHRANEINGANKTAHWSRALAAEGKARAKCMRYWPRIKGRAVLGEWINFGAMRHGPLNEQGVVFLFGAMAERLGFAVDDLQTAFPDCEAMRREGDGWRRVRIEFEYESRNFREHGHDAAGCDLIVCWRHNWKECPVEVIALCDFVVQREMTNDE